MKSDKDRLAAAVLGNWNTFENALASPKRAYPMAAFRAFADAARRYIEAIEGDYVIHREVASTISGLNDSLQSERKRVPGKVLYEADRLHCMLFLGYDPYFEGGEPSRL